MKKFFMSCLGGLLRLGRALLDVGQWIRSLLGPTPGWTGLKRWFLQIATLVIIASSVGFLLVTLGLVPIKASSGHWPITEWFLKYGMSRAVSTQSLGLKVPALDDPGLIMKGATHYETGCSPCHGKPSVQHPRIAWQMLPPPPYLPHVIHDWKPEELLTIVKHGVKFTGMPAWPAQQRDDEVWAMVAFLNKFPELNEQEYSRMVRGSLPADATSENDVPLQSLNGRAGIARSLADSCARCHGKDGQGRDAGVAPKLAGQQSGYLEASLEAYKRGERHSGIMEPIAAALSREELRDVAVYFSNLAGPQETHSSATSELAIRRGATIASEGVKHSRIPICTECHGPSSSPRNSAYPTLAGQYADYIVLQLELFADEHRGGSKFAAFMHPVADLLTPEQRRDVALFYESLTVP